MPRPRQYVKRVDTKVRIREDQSIALQSRVEGTGLSRNRLIEQAIDLLLEVPIAPRLAKAPADPRVVTSTAGAASRTRPRLASPGESASRASERAAAASGRLPGATPSKSRRSPRPRI